MFRMTGMRLKEPVARDMAPAAAAMAQANPCLGGCPKRIGQAAGAGFAQSNASGKSNGW
jgi:hypothetical protein